MPQMCSLLVAALLLAEAQPTVTNLLPNSSTISSGYLTSVITGLEAVRMELLQVEHSWPSEAEEGYDRAIGRARMLTDEIRGLLAHAPVPSRPDSPRAMRARRIAAQSVGDRRNDDLEPQRRQGGNSTVFPALPQPANATRCLTPEFLKKHGLPVPPNDGAAHAMRINDVSGHVCGLQNVV